MPSLNLQPQDYGHPDSGEQATQVETVDVGIPADIPDVDDDVQSDPALSVYPAADWTDEGGAPAPPK